MLIQYVWWAAGDAVEQGAATAGVAEVAAKHTCRVGMTVTGHPDPAVTALWVSLKHCDGQWERQRWPRM